ncbi:MAG: rhodanese-like domain-containing protein [Gammaproteobacteria bacterium]
MNFIHIAGYKFTPLNNLSALREQLKTTCADVGLKGTILLSPEGVNIMLSGMPDAIQTIKEFLNPQFSGICFREVPCETPPFQKMLVKIKKEIISMDKPGLLQNHTPAPYVHPTELKKWLDENRDIILLDTRNVHEIEAGTFDKAVDLQIKNFRHFPEAIERDELRPYKNKPIVTFCTGGIRCEKAALALQEKGFTNVYQLEGGILNYFDQCGRAHYHGDCFVFDDRIAE